MTSKIYSVNFSYASNSMGHRGLTLMSKYVPFTKMITVGDYGIPVCTSNKADGNVPDSVKRLNDDLLEADAYVFSIAEMMGGYCGAFKNTLDWLVCLQNESYELNIPYSISHKPMVVVTFTPSYKNGSRHWTMTSDLLEKLNCDVKKMYLFNDCLHNLFPDSYEFVEGESKEIFDVLKTPNEGPKVIETNTGVRTMSQFLYMYDEWENRWKDIEN